MAYTRAPSRAPSDRRSEFAIAEASRAEVRLQQDALLDNRAGKWRYTVPPSSARASARKS